MEEGVGVAVHPVLEDEVSGRVTVGVQVWERVVVNVEVEMILAVLGLWVL